MSSYKSHNSFCRDEDDDWPTIHKSISAANTVNPIRKLVDFGKFENNPQKHIIRLSLGDPTVFGNLKPDPAITAAVQRALVSNRFNGYAPSVGLESARQAVAEFVSNHHYLDERPDCPKHVLANGIGSPSSKASSSSTLDSGNWPEETWSRNFKLTAADIVMASSCSGALEMSLAVLANPGQNVLIPRPGFSLYRTLAESMGIECRAYNLLPERSWEIDLDHLASLVDKNSTAIIVNSPSNPCGSVYSEEHLRAIVATARKLRLPIIADEVYAHMVFEGQRYIPIGSLSGGVPVLQCGGLTKTFLVPGWRMGWIVIYDRARRFDEVRGGLNALSTRLLGPCTIVQGAIPDIFRDTPLAFFNRTMHLIHENAEYMAAEIGTMPGLKAIMPQGAFYMMVGIDVASYPEFADEVEFFRGLLKEQSVMLLPASVFGYPNYVRLVLTLPHEEAIEACARLREFCSAHYRPPMSNGAHPKIITPTLSIMIPQKLTNGV